MTSSKTFFLIIEEGFANTGRNEQVGNKYRGVLTTSSARVSVLPYHAPNNGCRKLQGWSHQPGNSSTATTSVMAGDGNDPLMASPCCPLARSFNQISLYGCLSAWRLNTKLTIIIFSIEIKSDRPNLLISLSHFCLNFRPHISSLSFVQLLSSVMPPPPTAFVLFVTRLVFPFLYFKRCQLIGFFL